MKPWNDSRVAAGFFAGALSAMASSALMTTVGAQGSSTISGCVVPTNHNYLRIAGACAPGELKVSLVTGETSRDPKAPPPNKVASRVVAPFEVVDQNDRVILRVSAGDAFDRGLHVFTESGKEVAMMNVAGSGGMLKVTDDGSSEHAVTLAASDGVIAFRLRDGSQAPRVSIESDKATGMALRVFNPSGNMTTAIGHTPNGAGIVSLHDVTGIQRAFVHGTNGDFVVKNSKGMSVAGLGAFNDMGVIEIVNGQQSIARLTQGDGGTGLLQVMDASGTPLVDASIANGLGFVRAYPMSKVTVPGIPGSSIQGRK